MAPGMPLCTNNIAPSLHVYLDSYIEFCYMNNHLSYNINRKKQTNKKRTSMTCGVWR